MGELPVGTVTFLFTDLEGSTRLWEAQPDAMRGALARHDEILRDAVEKRDGVVVKTTGDGLFAAFGTAHDGVAAAVDAQRALGVEPWDLPDPLRVRMGLHTGEAAMRDDDYFGPVLNRAARVSAAAHGGQVVLSHATEELVRDQLPDEVTLEDLGEHHLRDLARPERVFQVNAPGLASGFPALRSLASSAIVRTNLPLMPTDLVGRESEVAELVALVAEQRLVTLAGPGGIGKTRLAMEVAATVADEFADGVWFVDLAPVVEDDDVARATVAAMGATGVPGSIPALLDYLDQRRVLLVLDNCEHVIDGAASMAEALLGGAPEVRTITTSRELLEVQGEVVRWVSPLAVPEGDETMEALSASPAVSLFEERARAVRPDFTVDDEHAGDVAEICRRLDGVPLALELAAARVVSMSPHDIRERLGERFRLLAGGRRRQDRHRTLQAAVGWSYDLLEAEDQRVFRALSVFGGSFDLEAAAAVVGGDELDVADTVAGLARRSLVVHEGATGRHRLLETLRQFGADRLVEAGESEEVQQRFAAHFVAVARREAPHADDDGWVLAERRVMAEMENLRAVAEWMSETDRATELVALTGDLWVFLTQDAPTTGLAWLDPLIERGALSDPQVQYDALRLAATMAIVSGDFERAMTMTQAGKDLLGQTDAGAVLESPWGPHAEMLVASHLRDKATLRGLCARMRELALEQGDAYALHFSGCIELIALDRDDPQAEARIAELLAAARETGSPVWLAPVLSCASAPMLDGDLASWRRDELIDLYETNPGWEQAGPFLQAVVAHSYSLGLTARDPVEAARVALAGVRLADRVGVLAQRVGCLNSLVLATALAGGGPPVARLLAHLRTELAYGTTAYDDQPRLVAERLLVEQGVDLDGVDQGPLSRAELLDLLAEIEADLDALEASTRS